MIARFCILLPFDVLITESNEWPGVEVTSSSDLRIIVYTPSLYMERPKTTDSLLGQGMKWKLSIPSFTENLVLDGCKVGQVNVLTIDFIKPEFDRSINSPVDPEVKQVFEVANAFLARVRVSSRAFQIKPLVAREPWQLRYFTDDLQELER